MLERDQGSGDLTVLSTFSGAGGLDIGLERAGFRAVGCLEIDDDAVATLALNRPQWPMLSPSDVMLAGEQLQPADLGLVAGKLDLIAGGPPCQPFSKAAQWSSKGRGGMADDRGQAIHGMLDLVESFLPRALLIENVAGFLRGPGSAHEAISHRLKEVNARHGTRYALGHEIVDAAAYGVPQHRQRAIAIAFRETEDVEIPGETHRERYVTAWDALHDVPTEDAPPMASGWGELLPCIPEGKNYLWLTDRGGGEPVFGYRTRYWSFLLKLAKDRPSWTLAASPGPSTGPFHWENRQLTIGERLRLQSFPDDWRLVGNDRAKVRLVGNATPPLLAEVMGLSIRRQLSDDDTFAHRKPSLARAYGPQPPPAVPPTSLPESYRHLVGEHAAHGGTGKGPAPRIPRS